MVIGPIPREPETAAHAREHATYGQYEVVISHEEHGEIGTLDKTFDSDVEAGWAAYDAQISDVGITAEIRDVESQEIVYSTE